MPSKKELTRKIEILEGELSDRKRSRDRAVEEKMALEKRLHEITGELNKVKTMVREQTEADILVNAFKAVGIIKDDSSKKPDYWAQHNEYLVRLQSMAPGAGSANYGTLNFLGGNLVF